VIVYDENVSDEKRIDAVLASASIPWLFPTIKLDGHVMVDGFTYTNLNLNEAILKCREFGFEDKDIIADMILCHGEPLGIKQFGKIESKYMNAYDIWNRKGEFNSYYEHYEDVARVVRGYPEVYFRHMIAPTKSLESNFFDDGPEKVKEMIEIGIADGKANIDKYYYDLVEEMCKKDPANCDKTREEIERLRDHEPNNNGFWNG
jgi:predicted patatin/cPLA2 family phospholipase